MQGDGPSRELDKIMVRLPPGFRQWLGEVARANRRSVNSQVVMFIERALREGEMTAAGNSPEKHPAAANRHEATLAGGPVNTHAFGASADANER